MSKNPIFWSRLESDADIAKNPFGPSCTRTSGAYASAIFGNGFNSSANLHVVDMDSGVVMVRKGCIETWFIPGIDSSAVGTEAALFAELGLSSNYFCLRFVQATSIWQARSGILAGNNWCESSIDTYTAGDKIHMAMVWDYDGIGGGSDTMRIYKNGVEIGNSTLSVTERTGSTIMRLGSDYGGVREADGIIDNLKIWDYAKIDFSDRYRERAGCNDMVT